MIKLDLCFFGGRGGSSGLQGGGETGGNGKEGGNSGKRYADNDEQWLKGTFDSDMTRKEMDGVWNKTLTEMPVNSEIVLHGRDWENRHQENIKIKKVSDKEVEVQHGSGDKRTRSISDYKYISGTLQNYYVSYVDIDTGKARKSIRMVKSKSE